MRSVDGLLPYARNARTHSEEQVAQIAQELAKVGVDEFRFCVENDCYVVDPLGNIYRICREQQSKSGRLIRHYEIVKLQGSLDVYGYRTYRMRVDGIKKHVKGHRIVLSAWSGVHNDKVVNHKNGNKLDNRVKITNLPEECTVTIYDMNGTLIRQFKKADPLTSLDWDLKNGKNIPIASGTYIIHVNVPGAGEKVLKWFGVMRPVDLDNF